MTFQFYVIRQEECVWGLLWYFLVTCWAAATVMTMEIDQLGGFLNSQQTITIIGQTQTQRQGPNTDIHLKHFKIQYGPSSCWSPTLPCRRSKSQSGKRHIYYLLLTSQSLYCYRWSDQTPPGPPGFISLTQSWNLYQGQVTTLSIKVCRAGRYPVNPWNCLASSLEISAEKHSVSLSQAVITHG